MTALQIGTGRCMVGVTREGRVCKECGGGEVEDLVHWLLRCAACMWKTHKEPLLAIVQEHQEVDHDNLAAFLCM